MTNLELLQKAMLEKDPANFRQLARAARRIEMQIQMKKRKGTPQSLDSAHLHQMFENAIHKYGPEGLLKMGMLLRTDERGHMSSDDIKLLNMLPFYIHKPTNPEHVLHPDTNIRRNIAVDPMDIAKINSEGIKNHDISNQLHIIADRAKNGQLHPEDFPALMEMHHLGNLLFLNPKMYNFLPEILHLGAHGHGDFGLKEFIHSNEDAKRMKLDQALGGSSQSWSDSKAHNIIHGRYGQTSLRYGNGQGIMDWISRYAPTMKDIKGKRRSLFYHGAKHIFNFYDPIYTKSSHNYGVGLYTNKNLSVPISFSELRPQHWNLDQYTKERNLLYPYAPNANDSVINKLVIPSSVKFFHHDVNYSKTKVPKQMSDYFDNLAERMGRPDLKGAFEKTLMELRYIPIGHAFNPITNEYQQNQKRLSDELTDFSQHKEMGPNGYPILVDFYNPNRKNMSDRPSTYYSPEKIKSELYGHYLHRAARITFEKFGAKPDYTPVQSKSNNNSGDSSYYASPYRSSVFHVTGMLGALGFGGYRHLDPETYYSWTPAGKPFDSSKDQEGMNPQERSVVIFPHAFTEMPASILGIAFHPGHAYRDNPSKPGVTWSASGVQDQAERDAAPAKGFRLDTLKKLPAARGKRGRFEGSELFAPPPEGPRPPVVFRTSQRKK